jgi:hypothetical protein
MSIIRLLIPLLLIVFGFVAKKSEKEQFDSVKKYWLWFVIGGAFMFLFRLLKYLNG